MDELINDAIVQPLKAALSGIVAYVPVLLVAVAVLAIGLAAAFVASRLARRVFLALPIEKRASQFGFASLEKGDVKHSIAHIVGVVAWWAVFLLFLDLCANVLRFELLSRGLESVLLYLPRVILAAFILLAAHVAGAFLGGLARVWVSKVEGINAPLVGKAVRYALLFVGVVMALEKLYLATPFLIAVFVVVFGAVMLAAAIAFGLAFAEPAKDVVNRWLKGRAGGKKTRPKKADGD